MPIRRLGPPLAPVLLVSASLLFATPALARVLDLPVRDAAHPDVAAPAYLGDRLVIRLRPAAAGLARPLAEVASARPGLGLRALDAVARRHGAVLEPEFPAEPPPEPGRPDLAALWLVYLGPDADLAGALDAFAAVPEVEEASPVAVCPVSAVPDDSLWSIAWQLQQDSRRDIHVVEAWESETGDPAVPIAIIDTGVLRHHPDLGGSVAGEWGNLWTNAAERAGLPGVDDDGNGYVDDVWGWDFVHLGRAGDAIAGEDWRDPDDDPSDFAGHGTAVASVAGAITGNRIGLSSPLWDTRLMVLRAGWASTSNPIGEMDMASAARAIRYATRNGARVINCSFATVTQFDLVLALGEAIEAGVLVVSAAGNNGTPNYITRLPQVLSVGATDREDVVTPFSNRDQWVDLVAPGLDLHCAIVQRTGTDSIGMRTPAYTAGGSGTSFAAPLAAAGAALVIAGREARGHDPLTPLGLVLRLRETSADISGRNLGTDYGDGRLDIGRALHDPPGSFTAPSGAPSAGTGIVLRTERGATRLVTPLADGRLMVVDASSGDTLPGTRLPGAATGSIAAAWLGPRRGNGLFVPLADGRIAAVDERLRPLPGWPVTATPSRGIHRAQLALGDLDGDRTTEVVWGGTDGAVHVWSPDGVRRAGFPRAVGGAGGPVWIALADLDGREGLEIVAVSGDGVGYVLRHDGTLLPGWPRSAGQDPVPPVAGRIRAGGATSVLLGGNLTWSLWSADGEPQASRYVGGNPLTAAPALADLQGDGRSEVVIASGDKVNVLDSDLDVLPGTATIDLAGLWASELLAGPIGSVGTLGLALILRPSTVPPVLALYSPGGQPLRFSKPGYPGAFPVLDDIDGDGRTEVFTGANQDSELVVYDLGSTTWRVDRAYWPTARGNAARTGSTSGAPPLAPLDDAAPFAVHDLEALAVSAHGATLAWSAPADSGFEGSAARYQVRFSTQPLDAVAFEAADSAVAVPVPDSAGVRQTVTLGGLEENAVYHVALRSIDGQGNASALSNPATFVTSGDAPGSVRDLRVAAGNDTSVTLRWTASGDDGPRGRAARYLVRAARAPLDDAGFDTAERAWTLEPRVDGGAEESRVLGGFAVGERWWFALRTEDAKGNRSALSNVASALTGPLAARAGAALTAAANPARAPVSLYWQGASESPGAEQRVRVYDLNGRLVRILPVGRDPAGVTTWDGRDDAGTRVAPGLYFARLESHGRHAAARFVLLR